MSESLKEQARLGDERAKLHAIKVNMEKYGMTYEEALDNFKKWHN